MIFLLYFRTEVPDQMVVLDPQLAAVDQNYTRILQRYKVGFLVDHLLEAGKTVFSVSGSSRDTRRGFSGPSFAGRLALYLDPVEFFMIRILDLNR